MAIKIVLVLAVLLVQLSAAGAQEPDGFPSEPVNMATLRTQDRAEQLFEQGDFEAAYFIYRNELAPIGDKYSQYMVGFMLLSGKGVQEDRVEASAWYRLAAERGTREFSTVRDQLMATLTPEQAARSDYLFLDLRRKYGDLALLMQAVREDYDILRSRTGSRLAGDSSSLKVISGSTASGASYYGRVERRMHKRLEFIVSKTSVEIEDLGTESVNIDAVEASVRDQLERLP